MKRTLLLITLIICTMVTSAQDSSDELARKIEGMAKVGACYSPTFSPDDSEIIFISNISGLPQLWKIPVEGGWPMQLTGFNDPVFSSEWSPTENKIAFQLSPGGWMNSQIFMVNGDGT